ncbi:hypothetical protein BU14_0256s0034 [Porphyra umbilicalis]|uniref:Phospholipase/carboxylesterase/thioesterase domain-containing protein n=1 Tax=Porphyra umbilicalis TaxID=2786 RepID=A0A1X6P2J5_PORUM|nr:hypothetical protein BU14_0256s0034 [Porphyra umbilicalis]|eukprot:OSX75081.1 hypothetical protein BU14_0256s0034 [Porphyra umbilicalis]
MSPDASSTAAFEEPYVFPPTRPEPYPMERRTYRSFAELADLLASNDTVAQLLGSARPEDIPPPTPLTCGRRLSGTAHRVRCAAGPPLGGYVLEPPQPATASIVFLHGFTDTPWFYATFFRSALTAAPELFASVRVVVPLAPVYRNQSVVGEPPGDFFAWFDAAAFLNTTLARLTDGADVATAEAALRADTAMDDRLGLFLSTRRVEAVIARERDALRTGGAPGGGRVLLVGHSLGAAMATHIALVSRAHLDGVVLLQGFVPAARTLLASKEAYNSGERQYAVELVGGGADRVVPAPVVEASARIVEDLLPAAARVKYTVQAGVSHSNFFSPGPGVEAAVGVLRRFLE